MAQKWEYKTRIIRTVFGHDAFKKTPSERAEIIASFHDDLGEFGWELVSQSPYDAGGEYKDWNEYTYKRPKED